MNDAGKIQTKNSFTILEFVDTPIIYHFFDNGEIYYVINQDGNEQVFKENDLDASIIENYWHNTDVVESSDDLPFRGGKIIHHLKNPDKSNINNEVKFIMKNDDNSFKYSIISGSVANSQIYSDVIDWFLYLLDIDRTK